ncbi:hypothetical protein BC936DRAFT_145286 [Jimgerdemannia flammicorona]|uniref:Uncharacterized protein n=2 Tax=Jimgerdemannia flammicorona TaxID=994334 RepID=A0A433DAF9_9FUNG|nr:hypothetical protein BC936DRAFT_145286 [Jimgerdemannia flammicorona]RUS28086.1 hypothetical protein BC938DRAFT_482341 [Jimgerdemannia flammicorona]
MLKSVSTRMAPPGLEDNYSGLMSKSTPRAVVALGFRGNSGNSGNGGGSSARFVGRALHVTPKHRHPSHQSAAAYQLYQPQSFSSAQALSAVAIPTLTVQPSADLAETELNMDPAVGEAAAQLSQMAVSPSRSSQPYPRKSKSTSQPSQNGETSPLTSPKAGPSAKASTNLSHIPCKFFKAGACTAGKNCVFSHNKDPTAESYVCKYYLKGNCKFGNKCALSHQLPNDRKGMNGRPMNMGRLTASHSSGTRSSSGQMEMRSPRAGGAIPIVGEYGQSPVSPNRGSFGDSGSPFNRISIGAKSPTMDHSPSRPFSHLTASIKQPQPQDYYGSSPSSFYDEPRKRNLIAVAPSSSNHLAPLPIRQKPVPDVYKASPTGSDLGSSPFHNPSATSLFLPPMSYGSDNGGVLSPSHLQTLRSIPEGGDYFGDVEDYVDEEDLDLGQEQGILPASLNELLTPNELEIRRQRDERVSASFRDIRRIHSDFERDDRYLSLYSSSADPHNGPMLIGRSLPVGVGVGLGLSRSYGSQRNGDQGSDETSISFFFKSSPRGGSGFEYQEDLSIPGNNNDTFASHQRTTAINIPGSHSFSQASHSVPTGHGAFGKPLGADPFSPFLNDDEVQFYMEDEEPAGGFGGPYGAPGPQQGGGKAPMSYSAIAKSGLKDSGAAGGVSIDSRRNEPVRGP